MDFAMYKYNDILFEVYAVFRRKKRMQKRSFDGVSWLFTRSQAKKFPISIAIAIAEKSML